MRNVRPVKVGDCVLDGKHIYIQSMLNMRSDDICGRIGGDEFLVFARNMRTEGELVHFTQRINDDYLSMLKALLGDQLKFPVGISIGAASVPAHGREFDRLFHLVTEFVK